MTIKETIQKLKEIEIKTNSIPEQGALGTACAYLEVLQNMDEERLSHLPTPSREELRIKIAWIIFEDEILATRSPKQIADSILALLPEYEEVELPENPCLKCATPYLQCAGPCTSKDRVIADIPTGSDGKLWRVK